MFFSFRAHNKPSKALNMSSKNSCTLKQCNTCALNKSENDLTCDARKIVYVIECTNCNMQYVGSSKRNARTRMREHLQDLSNDSVNSMLMRHFRQKRCNLKSFSFKIVYDSVDDPAKRYELEFNEIVNRNTIFPFGLNERIPNGCQPKTPVPTTLSATSYLMRGFYCTPFYLFLINKLIVIIFCLLIGMFLIIMKLFLQ